MANITEVSQWENVIRQIENGEAATGGADGLANIQAKQLANRTKWLKDNYLPLTGGALNGNSLTWNGNDLADSAIVAKSLASNGYIKYASGLIIQWGYINSSNLKAMNSYYYVDVPLNISFSDVGYQAFSNFSIAPDNLGPFPITVCLPREKNKITISTNFYNEYSFQIKWLAIGY